MRKDIILFFFLMLSMIFSQVAPAVTHAQDDTFVLPDATGPYLVGRTRLHWIDESRDELNTDEEDYRELIVTIWYPAYAEEGAEIALYRGDLSRPDVEEVLAQFRANGIPTPLRSQLELKIHAYDDAPISEAESSYPVLTFSHGSGDLPEDYSLQLLELASHGYVVVGINHAYYSSASVFPDGRVIGSAFSRGFSESLRIESEMTGAEDVVFVLDQLELLNNDDERFAGRLDLERVGAFGHSMGGAIVVLAASMDPRIQAVVNEDGFFMPESYPAIEQPFMFFSTGTEFFPAQGPKYTLIVDEFEHWSFLDFAASSRSEGERTVEIIRVYLLAFFDKYLKDEQSALLDGPSEEFPEVDFQSRNVE